jgi:hypothetical protein
VAHNLIPKKIKDRQGFPQHWERRKGTLRERVAMIRCSFIS